MTAQILTDFLHSHIPATRLLAVHADSASPEQVRLIADYAINQNHHHTIFGGSSALVATACAWSLVHLNFPEAAGNIVIRHSEIHYDKPATADLIATCSRDDDKAWEKCRAMLARFNKGSISVTCTLMSAGQMVGTWTGQFVVAG